MQLDLTLTAPARSVGARVAQYVWQVIAVDATGRGHGACGTRTPPSSRRCAARGPRRAGTTCRPVTCSCARSAPSRRRTRSRPMQPETSNDNAEVLTVNDLMVRWKATRKSILEAINGMEVL